MKYLIEIHHAHRLGLSIPLRTPREQWNRDDYRDNENTSGLVLTDVTMEEARHRAREIERRPDVIDCSLWGKASDRIGWLSIAHLKG